MSVDVWERTEESCLFILGVINTVDPLVID